MYRFVQFLAKIKNWLKMLPSKASGIASLRHRRGPLPESGRQYTASWQEKAAAVFSSLTTRAALFTIITCSVPLLLVGWYFTDQMTKSLTQAAIQRNNQVADRIVNDIGTFILAQKNFLVLTSAKAEMQSMQPETMDLLLRQVAAYSGSNGILFVARPDGEQIYRTDQGLLSNISGTDYFQAAVQGTAIVSPPLIDEETSNLTIVAAAPIYDENNQVQGILGANIALAAFHTKIEHVLSQNPGYAVTVMDKNRVPLYHQMDTAAVEESRNLQGEYFRLAVEQASGFTEGIYRGQEYLISFRAIDNTDWVVLSYYPKEVALQSAKEMVSRSVNVTLMIIAVFVFIGLLAARQALSPLKQLVVGAAYIAEGHLSYRLATDRKDEFGTVAKAFNHMADRLGGIVGSVQESSRLVKNTADQVAASSDELRVGSGQVVLALESVNRQIEHQNRETQTTENLLEELVRISTAMSDSMKQVAVATDESVTAATQGQKVIDQAIGQIRMLQQLAAKTESMMAVLDQSAQTIGQISLTISQFSRQTNLLALNAAIEAARAGEQGRGFAVVADEVRKLANESSVAVNQIGEIVNKIQSETKEALTSMRQSCEYAGQGVDAAAGSGQAFSRIAVAVGHVQQEAGRIQIQTEKQVQLCQTAMEAMTSSNQLAMQTSAHAQEITSISQEQAQIALEMNHSTEKLRELSSRLDSMVTQFK